MDKHTFIRTLALLASLHCSAALAEEAADAAVEQLPDSVEHQAENTEALAERFSAPPLDQQAMEEVYLESPTLAKDDESDALSSLSDKDRYLQNDPLFQEQLRNSQDTITGAPTELPPPPPPITTLPEFLDRIREL